MYSGVKTTGCTDLFLFVRCCRRMRLPGFTKSVRKQQQQKSKTLDAQSRSSPVHGDVCRYSSFPAKARDVKVEQRGLGCVKPAVHLYLLVPLYHLLVLTLCARRQDVNWKEHGSVHSACTAGMVAAWHHAPGQMPPAVSCLPCAQY